LPFISSKVNTSAVTPHRHALHPTHNTRGRTAAPYANLWVGVARTGGTQHKSWNQIHVRRLSTQKEENIHGNLLLSLTRARRRALAESTTTIRRSGVTNKLHPPPPCPFYIHDQSHNKIIFDLRSVFRQYSKNHRPPDTRTANSQPAVCFSTSSSGIPAQWCFSNTTMRMSKSLTTSLVKWPHPTLRENESSKEGGVGTIRLTFIAAQFLGKLGHRIFHLHYH